MYQVNLLDQDKMEWTPLTFNGRPMVFSNKTTLLKALKDNLGVQTQILYNDWFLINLDGTQFQLDLFIKGHDHLLDKTIQSIETQKRYDEMYPKMELKKRRNFNE